MSVAPPPVASSAAEPIPARSGADELIDERIVEACSALWWAELVRAVLRMVIATMGFVLLWVVIDQWVYSPGMGVRTALFSVLVISLGWYLWRRVVPLLGSSVRPEYAARALERDLPDLRHSLTSYVTLRGDRVTGGLRSRVVRSIGAATAGKLKAHDELPAEATGTLRWWIATAVTLALLVAYGAASPKNSLQSAARLAAPLASIDPARRVAIKDVQPGDTEAIAGRALQVSAEIRGLVDDEEAICSWDTPAGRQQVVLEPTAGGRRFSGELWLPHSTIGDVDYMISAGDASAGPFRLRVQDVPVVAVESVTYLPPKYTGQAQHTSSSGAITALDLTRVTIRASTNRAIARGVIEFNPKAHGQIVQATAGVKEMQIASDGRTLSISFPLRSARGRSAAVELESYRIKVWDAADQSNPDPIIYPIRIVADLPPDISIMLPVKSPSLVPIDAQQVIEVHASDPDFGLRQIELEVRSGLDVIGTPTLWSDPLGAKGNQVTEYRFRPGELDLRVGDTVKVVALAVDNRAIEDNPSVEANVTRTDPIELKITASEPLPNDNDPDAEGLSAPDDRPASDHPPEEQESGEGQDGQDGSGGSGSGQSGDNQSGEGEGQSGQGGSSGDQSGEGQSGEGQSGQGQSGEGQSEENQSGEGGSGEGQSGEGQSGQDSASEGESSDGAGTGENMQGDGAAGEDAASGDEAAAGQEPTSDQQGSGQQQGGANQQGGGEQSGGQETSEGQRQGAGEGTGEQAQGASDQQSDGAGQSADGNQGTQDGQQAQADQKAQDGQGAQGEPEGGSAGQQAEDQSGPPKHDGDAFERIRDYLEQLQKQQQENSAGQSEGQQGDQQQSGGGSSQNESRGSSGKQRSDGGGDPSQSQDQQPSGDQGGASEGAADRQDGQQPSSGESGSEAGQDQQPSGDDSTGGAESQSQGSGGDPQGSGSGQEQRDPSSQQSEGASGDDSQSQDQNQGEGSQGQSQSGSSQNQQPESADGSQGEQGEAQAGQPSGDPEASAQGQSQDQQSEGNVGSPSGRPSSEDSSSSSQTPSGGGESGEGKGIAGQLDNSVPPDPVNVDYAKKATDMVLDYLEETRDSPDQDLLDKLDWSKEDLKRFADRWEKIRDMPAGDQPGARSEMTEALQSLGLRPPNDRAQSVREDASSIRRIRDAGNRKPPPAAYRDAFDAFRRAVGQQ